MEIPSLDHKQVQLVRKGDVRTVRNILADDAALLNALDGHRRSMLFSACDYRRFDLVKFLIKRGADVNQAGESPPITPYALTRRRGDDGIADYLLKHGAAIDFYTAIYLGMETEVREFLDSDPILLNQPHLDKWWHCAIPLQYAILSENIALAKFFLEQGATIQPHDLELLGTAADTGDIKWVQLLLEQGADGTGFVVEGALIVEHQPIADLLIANGGSVNAVDPNYPWSPIVYECRGDRGNHPERIRALLDYGADIHARAPGGKTALHCAAKAGFMEVIDMLIEHGAEIDPENDKGQTPLVNAMLAKRLDVALRLLDAGANPNVILNNRLETPLHAAVKLENIDLVRALLMTQNADLNARDKSDQTPLDLARQIGNDDIIAIFPTS